MSISHGLAVRSLLAFSGPFLFEPWIIDIWIIGYTLRNPSLVVNTCHQWRVQGHNLSRQIWYWLQRLEGVLMRHLKSYVSLILISAYNFKYDWLENTWPSPHYLPLTSPYDILFILYILSLPSLRLHVFVSIKV